MLQQTQVERVVPAFTRFIAEFNSFAALAAATPADVLRAWRGLGYNARAVRLQRLAHEVCARHGGTLPEDAAELRALPGVGPYTASAVRAFAFDRDEIALDTNVRRVVQRVRFGVETVAPRGWREIDEAARALLVAGRANDLNSALMDLGSSLCTARTPKCLLCPLASVCAAAPIDAAQLARSTRAVRASVPFEQTTRYLRGRIVDALRALPPGQAISLLDLCVALAEVAPDRTQRDVEAAVRALARDGIATFAAGAVELPR
jgi:A/G-specific adenine glycosylase